MKRIVLLFGWNVLAVLSVSAQSLMDSLYLIYKHHPQEDTLRVNAINEMSFQTIGIDYYKARDYADEALQLAEHIGYPKGIVTAKSWLALCHWIMGDSELAIGQALTAIDIIEKEKLDPGLLAECYRILGVTYSDLNELDKADVYIHKAEKLCLQTGNWSLLLRVYVGAGQNQLKKHQRDSALSFFNKALRVTEKHPNGYYLPVIYTNIGFIRGIQHRKEMELEYYQQALALAQEAGNNYAKANVLSRLGDALLQGHQFAQAESYLHQSQKIARAIGLKTLVRDNFLLLANLNLEQRNILEANIQLRNYYELKDSLQNEKKTRQIVELESLHEKEKKEQEIKLLLQERKIEAIWRYVLLTGFSIIGIASVVIYRLQRSRTLKAKELLVVQKALNDKLKENDTLKSGFFANISHEFRTPLSLIIAPLEDRLSSSNISMNERQTDYLMMRNARRLLSLVNQLLDLSKLDAGKMELSIQKRNLREFLKIMAASFDSLASSKEIRFVKDIQLSIEIAWYDEDKLEKIITNLLSNAFKFTPDNGTVTFRMHSKRGGEELEIAVTDTGKGIPKEDQPHVFSPFYQSKHTSDDGTGTGLGLALVKELVRLHEGTIELISEINEGTTIKVILPIGKWKDHSALSPVEQDQEFNEEQEEPMAEEIADDDLNHSTTTATHQSTVLIVEDNKDLSNYISQLLAAEYNILVARDGKQGVTMAVDHIPDLIVSDVMMPHWNGMELTERLKSDERTSHIPIILLTAKTDLDSKLAGFKLGADDYLGKPFSVPELKVRIQNLIEQRKRLASKYKAGIFYSSTASLAPSMDEKFLLKIKKVIEDNISDSNFGVERMADEIHLSRTQLFRKLKAICGLSPNELINDMRLQRAADMIRAKSDSLTQISYAVGFNVQSYFAKRFRKKFGVTPSEYSQKVNQTTS